MNVRIGLALLSVSVALAGGCTNSNVDASGELIPQARPAIEDVPMPMGFKFDDSRSRNFVAPGMRVIDHVYTGSGDKFAVARFYRKQMAAGGWLVRPETNAQGVVTLEFEKETDICRVILEDAGMFKNNTEIKIQVYPHGRANSGPRK